MKGLGDMWQTTLVIIKPETAQDGKAVKEIIFTLNDRFFIGKIKSFQFTKEQAEEFYKEHNGKEFYQGLVDYTISAPVIAITVFGVDAITEIRTIIGDTNPKYANEKTLRKLYGHELPKNAVHASDSVESATRELTMMFGDDYGL